MLRSVLAIVQCLFVGSPFPNGMPYNAVQRCLMRQNVGKCLQRTKMKTADTNNAQMNGIIWSFDLKKWSIQRWLAVSGSMYLYI